MSDWQPISTAPKNRKIDLWAKHWVASTDKFISERFPDCRWNNGDSMSNRQPSWSGLPKEWHATHWIDLPSPPSQPDPAGSSEGER